MEIHPPERPILSFKEFCVHIGTVTIGILIALSLEGLLEWRHHRNLVREARENIRSEILDNQRELSGHLEAASKNRADQENVLKWIADVQREHKSSIHSLSIGWGLAELNSTSWTTAQATGALALMDYAEVKRDAAVYQLQDEFLRLQNRAKDATINASTPFAVLSPNPEKASSSDLADEKSRIANSLTAIQVEEQMGRALQKRYAKWLEGH